MKRGLVFGTFDRFHPGHEWFLLQASKHCNHLTVCVALDSDVERRKGKKPTHHVSQRIRMVQEFLPYATVQAGDEQEGTWTVLLQEPIDICIIGYDQHTLLTALEVLRQKQKFSFEVIQLEAYFPERYKTSLI